MATGDQTARRPRGRRGRRRERSFGSTLGLTVLGALVPGSAFVAAGRRLLGFAVMTIAGIALMLGIGILLVERRPAVLAAELASRPNALLVLGIAVPVAALAWIVVIISGHLVLRPRSASWWQRGVGVGLVLALCVGVAYPSVWGTRAAFATHDFVTKEFTQPPRDVDGDGEVDPFDREDPWAGRPRLNVLLLGADAGDDRTGLRTDSVILASINTVTGDTVLLSLPRNLQDVPFRPGSPLDAVWPDGYDCGDECLLNAVYGEGELYADEFPASTRDPGVAAVRDAVSATLGLDVDFFLMVDLAGFERFVDALGGIDIDVGPERVPIGGLGEDGRPQPEWKIEEWIEPGFQHLNGYQTLWFARDRASGEATDYMRMRRQRCVLNALVEQAEPTTVWLNYVELATTAGEIITTDVPYQLFPALVELAGKVQATPIRSLPFTDDVIPDRANPDFDEIRALVQASLNPPPLPPPTTTPTTTTPPSTTDPNAPTTSPTSTIDPTIAGYADDACG